MYFPDGRHETKQFGLIANDSFVIMRTALLDKRFICKIAAKTERKNLCLLYQLRNLGNAKFFKLRQKDSVTTTACANYCGLVLPSYVDFSEKGKREYLEKNPPNTGSEFKSGNSNHIRCHSCKLTISFSGERHNALTACATRGFHIDFYVDMSHVIINCEIFKKI